jgi:hypothetical protein
VRTTRRPVAVIGTIFVAALAMVVCAPSGLAATGPAVVNQQSSGQGCATGAHLPVIASPWPGMAPDLNRAWRVAQGASITVAVVDTGVAAGDVPQLAGQVTSGPTVPGATGGDCIGHGTFVAGLIAAHHDQTTGFSGVAPLSHVLSVTVSDQSGNTTPGQIAAGINAAVAAGASVIDVSLVTATPDPALNQAVANATAAGDLVVAPATADGQNQAGTIYPAACPGALAVSDVGAANNAPPSTPARGAPVALAAPGDNIISVGVHGGLFAAAGPSYATAFVAGTAALVESHRGHLAPRALTALLENTAVHPGTSLPDPVLGYGVVDPLAALTVLATGGQQAAAPQAQDGHMTIPPPVTHPARQTALVIAGVSGGGLVFVVLLAATFVARRRRLDGDPPPA